MSKAATDPAGQIFRLTDMDVEEVSLVDRAANKKKFLVVKRDGVDMTQQVHPDGKGGFTTAGDGSTTKAGAPPMPPGKKKPTPPGAPAAKAGGMEVPPGFKEAVAPILDKAMAAIQALDEMVDSSTPADVPDDGTMPGVPADFSNGVTGVMNLLDRAASMWPAAPDDDMDGDEGAGGASDDESAGATGSQPSEMTMRLAMRNIEKMFGRKVLDKSLVQKIGAKMSKDRLTRLQQAVGVLANLVNEVAGQPAVPPTGAPPVGKAGTQKADSLARIEQQLAAVAGEVAKLARVVVVDHAALEKIQKSRGMPATAQVDGAPPPQGQSVSWPMDMNAPVSRETTAKSESFFED